ncbi:MAG: hypothetical protein A2378_00100 [Candidatus Pacebacteria bacterium RIFOXYB1_FULL_44_10]|nr:MAG: hypothetical protein A2378_00100 [Candidatus Pacebacteria bacterium RIFOXYB1_FULL_44_10]
MNDTPSPLRARLFDELKSAMKAREALKLDALRYMLSLIKNVEIDLHREVNDQEFISVIQKEVKKRHEAVAQMEAGGRTELAQEEKTKLFILESFLPKQMSKEEITAVVQNIIASSADPSFKGVIGVAIAQLKEQADGTLISQVVRELCV